MRYFSCIYAFSSGELRQSEICVVGIINQQIYKEIERDNGSRVVTSNGFVVHAQSINSAEEAYNLCMKESSKFVDFLVTQANDYQEKLRKVIHD